jgi:hypothetical protein
MGAWWEDRMNLVSVVDWAMEVGELQDRTDIVRFLEQPWHRDDLWRAMRESLVG